MLIDLVAVGDEEWEWMKKIGMLFALNVEEEKIVLYRKALEIYITKARRWLELAIHGYIKRSLPKYVENSRNR